MSLPSTAFTTPSNPHCYRRCSFDDSLTVGAFSSPTVPTRASCYFHATICIGNASCCSHSRRQESPRVRPDPVMSPAGARARAEWAHRKAGPGPGPGPHPARPIANPITWQPASLTRSRAVSHRFSPFSRLQTNSQKKKRPFASRAYSLLPLSIDREERSSTAAAASSAAMRSAVTRLIRSSSPVVSPSRLRWAPPRARPPSKHPLSFWEEVNNKPLNSDEMRWDEMACKVRVLR